MSQCEKTLLQGISELFTCENQGDKFRIETPFIYPDGDVIALFCVEEEGDLVVTDFTMTTGWLFVNAISDPRTAQQNKLIEEACCSHGVQFKGDEIFAKCRPDDSLADAVVRVAQACIRVSDLLLTFRALDETLVKDEVLEQST